jgi:hypothetical protein
MSIVHVVDHLDLDRLEPGTLQRFRVDMVRDGMGEMIRLPMVVARGVSPGPVVGFTAAVHGNELNGVRAVQRLVAALDPPEMRGTVVAVPVVNVPGYLSNRREFNDNMDLNRMMPGNARGTNSQVYAHRFIERVIKRLDYLIDLHTASFGRINSLYVRADLRNPITARMAYLQHPEIIVHNENADGTLRGAAAALGIAAITVELGDPLRFQRARISSSVAGSLEVLRHLGVIHGQASESSDEPVVCGRSYWLYTERGGVLDVFPGLADRISAGERIARVSDIFGETVHEYTAPEPGIVVGKSVNPVNQAGSRILHLGVVGLPTGFPDPSRTSTAWPKATW